MLSEEGINIQNYKIIQILGSGSFGQIFLVEDIQSQKHFVAKLFYDDIFANKNQENRTEIIDAILHARYPSILPNIGYSSTDFYSKNHPILISNYLQKGNLYQVLKEDKLTITQKFIIIVGIALGVEYLHSQNIIHCNLNPENILIDDNYFPHITDFGIFQLSKPKFIKYDPPIYISPEILEDKKYDSKVDAYSYGLLVYKILTGLDPIFEGPLYTQMDNIIKGKRFDLTGIESPNVKNLIIKCWSSNPLDRPSFGQIIKSITDPMFYTSLNVDYSVISEYLSQFNLQHELAADNPKTELKMIKVCGANSFLQLGQDSNNKTSDDEPVICPSVTSNLDINSISSITSYNNATIVIYDSNRSEYSGSNSTKTVFRPNLSAPVNCINNPFCLKISTMNSFDNINAVCGTFYTLYIVKEKNKKSNSLVYSSSKDGTSRFASVLKIGDFDPIALYGGSSNSAAIDSKGSIIFVPSLISRSIHSQLRPRVLPDDEKAVYVAYCNNAIFVLSKNGYVFKYEEDKFIKVEELEGIKISQISGTFEHCLAVSSDGKVFGWGLNKSGCIGIDKKYEKIENFIQISTLANYKIVNAYAGLSHSLFQTDSGMLLACGSNKYGQLFLDEFSDDVNKPVETAIKSGASFCIAGENISLAFINGYPANCPNQKCNLVE